MISDSVNVTLILVLWPLAIDLNPVISLLNIVAVVVYVVKIIYKFSDSLSTSAYVVIINVMVVII